MADTIVMNRIIIFFESEDGGSKPGSGHWKPETENRKLKTTGELFEGRGNKEVFQPA